MLDDLIRQLTARTFELSLPRCELRQCGTPNPKTYSGSGFVRQEADGHLVLRMFATAELDERKRLANLDSGNLTSGVLIPDSAYYDLTATDQGGHAWRADHQSIEQTIGVGIEVHAQLQQLEKIEAMGKNQESVFQGWFVPVVIDLPWHVRTTTERGMSLDRFEFDDEAFAWKAHKEDGGLYVHLTVKRSPLEPHAKRFLHALEMLVGKSLEPLVSYRGSDGQRITRIHPPPTKMPPHLVGPMRLQPFKQHDAHHFLACCLRHAEQLQSESADSSHPEPVDQLLLLCRFWHRIVRAQSTDMENSALVLSVAIEGVLNAIFHNEHDADVEFTQLLETATPVIKALDVNERVRESMLMSLEHAARPKSKDTMQRLKEQGALTQGHIKAWKGLRNAGAHGALLEEDGAKLQQHLNHYFCCLDLFYRLIFVAIGYQGACVDLSKTGWPESTFPEVTTIAITPMPVNDPGAVHGNV